jgi:hypothetical protein
MESIQVISVEEFWRKHRKLTREIIKEEILNNLPQTNSEEILLMDDVCSLLGKSKQTIFLWLEKGVLQGHYINDSLFFMRSEIMDKLKQGRNKSKSKTNKL